MLILIRIKKFSKKDYIMAADIVDAVSEEVERIVGNETKKIVALKEDQEKNSSLSIENVTKLAAQREFETIKNEFNSRLKHMSVEHPLYPHYGYIFQNGDFRKALSLCINRTGILSDVYAGAGNATAQPFNPKAEALNSKDFSVKLTDSSAAAELLTLCGYSQKNENGMFTLAEQEVRLRLLVNSENASQLKAAQVIKLNLEAASIGVDIISEHSDSYRARISVGDYDLFLGEIKLSPDNDISALLNVGALNACNDMGVSQAAYLEYLADTLTLEDYLRKFDLITPFIPILYRNGTAVYSGTINGNQTVTEYDVFASMDKWEF